VRKWQEFWVEASQDHSTFYGMLTNDEVCRWIALEIRCFEGFHSELAERTRCQGWTEVMDGNTYQPFLIVELLELSNDSELGVLSNVDHQILEGASRDAKRGSREDAGPA